MEVPVAVVGANWPFYPNFVPAAALQACIFLKFCMYGTYNNKQINEMQNIWNFKIFFLI